MNNFFTKTVLSAAIVGATISMAHAQAVLEEVTVTATKRVESLQDVPISVAAVSAQKMSDFGLVDMESLSTYVPNFTINETGIGNAITIRGISSGINPGFEQSVGMYNDGIFYGRDQLTRMPMMDLERVEVLRGPQGILFGKNSIAGAVSMISAKPTDEFEASVKALYEPDASEGDIRATISGPITDNLGGRLAVLYREMDGYMDNTYLGQDEQQEEETYIRGSLRWDATDDFVADLKVSRATFDVEGRNIEIFDSIGAPDHLSVLNSLQGALGRPAVGTEQDYKRDANGDMSDNTVDNATLRMDWSLDSFTVTSITGYVDYEYDEVCDCDFSGALVFDVPRHEDYKQFSQELRLTSPGGETFDYIAGVFYQTSELNYTDDIALVDDTILTQVLGSAAPPLAPFANLSSTGREFAQDSDLWAVFAQVTWNISDTWRLTVGGRYTDESKDASRSQLHVAGPGFGGSVLDPAGGDPLSGAYNTLYGIFSIEPYDTAKGDLDESAFTPVVTAQWDMTDDTMLYATWTKGFKSGGFDARANAHPDPAVVNAVNPLSGADLVGSYEFDKEEANSAELGSKMRFAGGVAELNVALYRTEYTDLQVSQFDGTLGFNVTNAGEATVQGVELDGRWAATDFLTFGGAVAYLDFEYDSFPNSQCAFGQTPNSPGFPGLCDVTGERKEYTPEWTASLTADWRRPLGDNLELRAGLDVNYMDSYLYAPNLDSNAEQDATAIWNGRIALASANDTWEIAVLGRNLSDEVVINYGGNTPLATTLTRGGGNSYYGFVNRPLNVAVQLSFNF